MKYTPKNIKPGMKLWYRKKGSWDVDYLLVKEVGKGGFSFRLSDGRVSKCSYEYASRRLFTEKNALSTTAEEIEMERTYGNWSGSAAYSGQFSDDEFEHMLRIIDQKAFED